MNVAFPFHPRYLILYTGYRPLADYSRKSCISIYHAPPTNVNDDSTLKATKSHNNWFTKMGSIFNNLGFSYLFDSSNFNIYNSLCIKQRITDIQLQEQDTRLGMAKKLNVFYEILQNRKSKKISNDQELIQSDPTSCPQNQKGNN